ncbi:MAG: alpha/beta hydrolase [Desulfobacterales bacterium]|jgi:pimeloyl-ACP methyl ester carboxylesterase
MKLKKDIMPMPAHGSVFSAGGFWIKQYQKELSSARGRILEDSQVVKTAHGPIEYSTAGKGLPVLFVHGAGGGHDMGLLFAQLIGDDFFWICPSRFGYLRTPIPPDASFESQADAYAALLDYLQIEKAAIIGLSIGGPSALLFALRHPNRCAALVLQSAISKTTPKRPISDWFYNALFRFDFIYWAVSHTVKNFLINKFGVNPAILKSLSQDERKWVEEGLHIFHPASKRYPGIRNDQKATISNKQYDLDRINLPTLILHALDDRLVGADFATYAHARIRNSELITYSSGGHFVVGIHQQCRDAITGFLKKHL